MKNAGAFRTPLHTEQWIPSAANLLARAKHMVGSASGLDGWDASELTLFPEETFELFRSLACQWGQRQDWPSVWQDVRQVHLRKDNTHPFAPCAAKDMRPISIFSTWYRLLIGTFMSQDSVREWIEQVVPPQAHGGIRKRWVATALTEVMPHFDAGCPALALDYAKCFDHVDPKLALTHLRLHLWPEELVSLLQHVWLQQRRFLQLGKCTLEEPAVVTTSLPQGDPASPLGLLLVLGDAIADISASGINQATFLDDRVLVAPTVRALLSAHHKWKRWSARIGLVENTQKTLAFAQTYHQRMAFERAGFDSEQIRDQLRILGVDVFAPQAATPGTSQQERFKKGQEETGCLAQAPVSVQVREHLYRTRVVPKITWGWWVNPIPPFILDRIFSDFRRVGKVHKMASKYLRILLNGHAFSCNFMALQQSLKALRTAGLAGFSWVNGNGSWIQRVNTTLTDWDWSNIAPWQWQHPHEGQIDLLRQEHNVTLHRLRESWRRKCWESFCSQNRRDSRMFQLAPFSTHRCKAACDLFGKTSQHGRAVLTGAALSLSCYQVIYEDSAVPGCNLCNDPSIYPNWNHLCWQCPAFASGRPLSRRT